MVAALDSKQLLLAYVKKHSKNNEIKKQKKKIADDNFTFDDAQADEDGADVVEDAFVDEEDLFEPDADAEVDAEDIEDAEEVDVDADYIFDPDADGEIDGEIDGEEDADGEADILEADGDLETAGTVDKPDLTHDKVAVDNLLQLPDQFLQLSIKDRVSYLHRITFSKRMELLQVHDIDRNLQVTSWNLEDQTEGLAGQVVPKKKKKLESQKQKPPKLAKSPKIKSPKVTKKLKL